MRQIRADAQYKEITNTVHLGTLGPKAFHMIRFQLQTGAACKPDTGKWQGPRSRRQVCCSRSSLRPDGFLQEPGEHFGSFNCHVGEWFFSASCCKADGFKVRKAVPTIPSQVISRCPETPAHHGFVNFVLRFPYNPAPLKAGRDTSRETRLQDPDRQTTQTPRLAHSEFQPKARQ